MPRTIKSLGDAYGYDSAFPYWARVLFFDGLEVTDALLDELEAILIELAKK